MKKIITTFLILLSAFSMFACKTEMNKFQGNISEMRTNVYTAESDNMRVNAITGTREIPFDINGISEEKIPFTVITIEPKSELILEYSYSVTINGKQLTGKFVKHPFGNSYSCDIPEQNLGELVVNVTANEYNENFNLASALTKDMINHEKAFEIAYNKLKSNINTFKQGGKLNAEIYIRLINNPINNEGGYYWYVAFVNSEDTTYAVLIDPTSMEIAAIRD